MQSVQRGVMSSAAGAAGAGGGVGFLLDSAVRTAVGHLASSQPLQERRQHLDQVRLSPVFR